MAAYAREEEENEKAQRAMKEKIEEHKRQLAEKKAQREAEEMAQYAKEEEENEKAQRAMKEKIEEHKRQLAEKKAARVCFIRSLFVWFSCYLLICCLVLHFVLIRCCLGCLLSHSCFFFLSLVTPFVLVVQFFIR
jgi:Flp pilus assembly protein TadB